MELSFHEYLDGLKLYGKGLSVLYAEDSLEVQVQVESFLGKFFEDVRIASNGLQAWQAYNERRCDILITDIMMPEMDGVELCEKVIEIELNQKIVVVSAYNESDYLMKLINMGVDKFLLKPFDNKRFLRALYGVSYELFEKSERTRLAKELKENLETTQQLLDMLDDALVILEDNKIVRANLRFMQLAGVGDLETFNKASGRIDSIFISAKGYISRKSNGELLEDLQKEPIQKALIKDIGGAKVMLLRQKRISETSYIVMLTDVTTMEKDLLANHQKLLTNPFTGIPNKAAFIAKLTDSVEKGACSIIVAAIIKYDRIIKWYGKDAGIEVEKRLCASVKSILEHQGLTKSAYFANYDKNRFALIAESRTAPYIATAIDEIKLSYSHIPIKQEGQAAWIEVRTHTIHCAQGIPIEELLSDIERKFDMLIE